MLNPNIGKKFQIPPKTPADSNPVASQPTLTNKMLSQASEAAKSAGLPTRATSGRRGRRPTPTTQKTIIKAVYFEPPVHQALINMQVQGQNVSKYINRLVKQALAM